jgi:hypothetical protein
MSSVLYIRQMKVKFSAWLYLTALILTISNFAVAQTPNEVKIGTQVWMTKNLNVDKFRNGDPIPQAKTREEWKAAGENKQPAWCYYDNDPANGVKYGKLYNWYAVNDARGLAPAGYHVPSDAEWTILENQLGSDAGTKMKSTSGWEGWETGGSKTCPNCSDWNAEYRRKVPCHVCKDSRSVPSPVVKHSGNGTNSSGFNGQAGGFRYDEGISNFIGSFGYWWSSSEKDAPYAWYRSLNYEKSGVGRYSFYNEFGLSVRCLRDSGANEEILDTDEPLTFDPVLKKLFSKYPCMKSAFSDGRMKKISDSEFTIRNGSDKWTITIENESGFYTKKNDVSIERQPVKCE